MLSWLLNDIVCQTFQYEIDQGALVDRKLNKAMQIGVRRRSTKPEDLNKDGEDKYYLHYDLLLWAPSTYKQVWVRERNTPCFEGTKEYLGPWRMLVDHDSAWRETVGDFFTGHEHNLIGFSGVELFKWYSIVNTPKAIVENYYGHHKVREVPS